jgi:outer membrane autotransporter protein
MDTTIMTTGTGSNGAFAQDNGSISLTGSTVQLMQAGGGGAAYFANNATITATDTTALTTGPNSYGGMLSNGGNLTITRGSVTTQGSGSFGFLVTPVTPVAFVPNVNVGNPGVSGTNAGATNTLTIINATVSSASDAFHVTGATADITVNGSPSVIGNNGVLLNTLSSGITNFTDTSSNLTGAILTDFATSTAHVTLNTDTWNMTGSSNMTSLTESGSTINFAPPAAGADVTLLSSYKTLTTNTFVGAGGEINMNTYLAADPSPSDRIVITALNGVPGMASADPVSLFFHNTGGPGALTTANGILVVVANEVGGTTQPGMFVLDNPELRAGAFDYRLFRGGLDPSDPTVSSDWFLRSTFLGPSGPGETPEPPLPPEPPTEPLPPGPHPIIGPELATDGVVQPIARQMGLTTLGTYHERVGDAAADAACLNAPPDDNGLITKAPAITKAPPVPYSDCQQVVWGRLFGQQIDNHYEAFADPRASGQVAGIQAGADLWRGSLIPGHSDNAGVYFAYGNGNADVTGLVTNPAATAYVLEHTGSVNLNAYSIGGYWTHHGPGGWYIDAVLQGSFYNGNAATQFANLPISGTGFTSSLETGYPIPVSWLGPRFVLEPEGQIIWQQVSFRDDNDGLGPVGLGTTSGFTARLGLRGKWTITDPAGRVWQPYVLANVWRDWGADATTMFGVDPVPLLEQATRLEFAAGLSARILPGLSLYAQAGYQFAVSGTDGGTRDGVRGDFGAHYTW